MKTNKSAQRSALNIIIGMLILSFGLVNIHNPFKISEGGVLGSILLINYWTNIDMALISITLDLICYTIAFKYFGLKFILKSLSASFILSIFLSFWNTMPMFLEILRPYPLIAALIAGLCVGVGVGLAMRSGVSSGGDDALALVISKKFKVKLSHAYMFTDFTVLLLSLSYIAPTKIFYSLITVTISSYTIDRIVSFNHSYTTKTA